MEIGSVISGRANAYTLAAVLPSGDEHIIGVLLEDTESNRLNVKMRSDWTGIVPDDYHEYLAALHEDLCGKAVELGARDLLAYLTTTLSNFLRITDPEPVMANAQTLTTLYERNVES